MLSFQRRQDSLAYRRHAAFFAMTGVLNDAGGSLGVNLILGGYDVKSQLGRLRLTTIHPHGSMDVVPFAALGSGGLAAMAVLQSPDHPGLSREGAVEYNRAVVPEQQHIAYEDDQGDESTLEEKTSNGVNDFGNVPFAVNSRRVVASQHDESTRLKKWDALLGLFK
jgi:20S proteasome subunit beta 2